MKRVLVLHGHTENAHLFGRKFNDIRHALKDEVEFVFVDAPHLLTPVDPPGLPIFSTSTEFEKLEHMDPTRPTKHTPRAWYYYLRDAHDVWAVSQSIVYLRGILERDGPFHGIMGYSQGGAMAALVTGLLEYPDHIPHFKGIKHPPMEFCVSFSSFLVPKNAFGVPKNVRTPTLFVVGENDALVPPEVTHLLSKRFCNVRLEVHNGGHFVPRKPEWRTFLIGFFKAFAQAPNDSKGPRYGSVVSPLFAESLRSLGGSFVPSAGIPFPLMTIKEEDAKLKAREAITKCRRKSWTEVVPKTIWEGGFKGDDLDEIDEELERRGMEPVRFDEDYSVGDLSTKEVAVDAASEKQADIGVRVQFFEDVPTAPVNSRTGSLSGDLACSDAMSSVTQPLSVSPILQRVSSVPATRSRKVGDASAFGRLPPFHMPTHESEVDPLEQLLRVQTIGGREIVVRSAYEGEAPFDFEIEFEKGNVDVDRDVIDGSF